MPIATQNPICLHPFSDKLFSKALNRLAFIIRLHLFKIAKVLELNDSLLDWVTLNAIFNSLIKNKRPEALDW